MQVTPVGNLRNAWGLVSFTSRRNANDFNRAVNEIKDRRKVAPYFYPQGGIERVAGSDYHTYVLETQSDGTVFLDEEVVKDEEKLLKEMQVFASDTLDTTVIVIDGGGFDKAAIAELPSYERTFVLFPPYDSKKTLHVTEAKRQLWRKQISDRDQRGIERIRIS